MMIGLYVFFLIMFVYMYGGTKFAYHKKGQLILSQALGTVIANAVIYMSVIMVLGKFPFPTSMKPDRSTVCASSVTG